MAWNVRFNLPTPAGAKQEKTFRPIKVDDGGFLISTGCLAAVQRGSVGDADTVTIHEGERKADVTTSCGVVAVGTGGGANGVDRPTSRPGTRQGGGGVS